jgi:hypothetical protein
MLPRGRTDEVVQDLSLAIDQGSDLLGILVLEVGEKPCQRAMHGALAGLGLERVLVRHDKIAQTVHHLGEHVGGNDTVTQQFFLPLCPRRGHLFASSNWHADSGRSLEAIDTTRGYVMQQGSKAEIQ